MSLNRSRSKSPTLPVALLFCASLICGEAWCQDVLLKVDFEDLPQEALGQWHDVHFHGAAHWESSIVKIAGGGNAAQLKIKGTGETCDSFSTVLKGIPESVWKLEVKFRYRLAKPMNLHVDISNSPGCGVPYLREFISLTADNQWHDASAIFNAKGYGQDHAVLEFISEWGELADGMTLLLDDISVSAVHEPALRASLNSPGSGILVDREPRQELVFELVNATAESCAFTVSLGLKTASPVLTSSSDVNGRETLRLDASRLPPGDYEAVAIAGTKEIGRWPVRKVPARPNAVLMRNGVPYRNGKPLLILGLCHVSDPVIGIVNKENAEQGIKGRLDRERLLADVAARGFNTVHHSWTTASAEFYRDAAKHGLLVLSESRSEFDKVRQVMDEPNVLGWYSIDEPVFSKVPECRAIYEQYKWLDPYHPVMTAFASGGIGFGDTRFVDIAMPDYYGISSAAITFAADAQNYFVRTCREVLLRNDPATAVIVVPQLFTMSPGAYRGYQPSYDQIRLQLYVQIICGAKGFCYYAYFTNEPLTDGMPLNPKRKHWFLPESPLWNQIGKLNAELKALQDFILLGKETPCGIPSAGSTLVKKLEVNGATLLIVVNPTAMPSVTVTIPRSERTGKPLFDSPAIDPMRGTLSLPPYGVGVYKTETAADRPTASE